MLELAGKNVLITGGAVRVGRAMALAVAEAGANVFLHYHSSVEDAKEAKARIEDQGVNCRLLQADFDSPSEAVQIVSEAEKAGPLFGLVNSAAIFENLTLENTDSQSWQRHLNINLTTPFLLSQAFAKAVAERGDSGRIINVLDWRALRPGADHLPYTVSKAGLAALTQSLAVALAPEITVNAMALGAILPPSDGNANEKKILRNVPAERWAELNEVGETLLFLLQGPSYITGEIVYLDGGRHLV